MLLGVLDALRLVDRSKGLVVLRKVGNRLARGEDSERTRGIAELLMTNGYFAEQARFLVEAGGLDVDGRLTCGLAQARRSAPQLIEVLTLWEDVQIYPQVHVPPHLLEVLGVASSLLPDTGEGPDWVSVLKRRGDRAEMYSLLLAAARAGSRSKVRWVSRDDDSLGYDLEDGGTNPASFVEVKGSASNRVLFHLSAREWDVALLKGRLYRIEFWGTIDLASTWSEEYPRLRAAGYPVIIADPSRNLVAGGWTMEPDGWIVFRG